MDELMQERDVIDEKDGAMILSRDRDGRYVLSHAESGRSVRVDEHTASKLMLLVSVGETGKSCRIASKLMDEEVKKLRLDAISLAGLESSGKKHNLKEAGSGQEAEKKDGKNAILDAHVTGIGAGGDFHLTARVQSEKSGKVHEVKGMITGLDAALLRSDNNEQGKDGIVLRNAQALACENFEKGMSASFVVNNAVTMKT